MNSPINSGGSEHGAGGGRPAQVCHLILQLEYEQWYCHVFPPDLDGHLGPAAEEDVSDEMIPLQASDRSEVSWEAETMAGDVSEVQKSHLSRAVELKCVVQM